MLTKVGKEKLDIENTRLELGGGQAYGFSGD
jgi:hypothetical protein